MNIICIFNKTNFYLQFAKYINKCQINQLLWKQDNLDFKFLNQATCFFPGEIKVLETNDNSDSFEE